MLKIERAAILRSMNTETSNFQIRLRIGILLLKLVLEIGILGLFPSAFNQDDLSKNQKNKIASSAARNSKKSGLLQLKFSDLKNPCLNFLLIKI